MEPRRDCGDYIDCDCDVLDVRGLHDAPTSSDFATGVRYRRLYTQELVSRLEWMTIFGVAACSTLSMVFDSHFHSSPRRGNQHFFHVLHHENRNDHLLWHANVSWNCDDDDYRCERA